MPRPRSARSDMSDADMEGLQEQELLKLQRSFRNMEGDRAAYTEESQNTIRKQKLVFPLVFLFNTTFILFLYWRRGRARGLLFCEFALYLQRLA